MQRLSVIAEIQDMLPAVREGVRESSQYNNGWSDYYETLIGTIHPSARQPDRGPLTNMNRVTDKAFELAMDGEGRPSIQWKSVLNDYNKRLTARINDDIREGRRVCIYMLDDFGDGDYLFKAGSFVLAARTWSILALHSGLARYATPEESAMAEADAITQVDEGGDRPTTAPEFQRGNSTSPIRKAGLIHASRSAA